MKTISEMGKNKLYPLKKGVATMIGKVSGHNGFHDHHFKKTHRRESDHPPLFTKTHTSRRLHSGEALPCSKRAAALAKYIHRCNS